MVMSDRSMKRMIGSMFAVVAASSLILAGCSGNDGASAPTTTPTPSIEAVGPAGGGASDGGGGTPTTDSAADQQLAEQMQPGEVTPEQFAAVQGYLDVRENAESIRYPTVEAWQGALDGVVSAAAKPEIIEWNAPDTDSPVRRIGAQHGYAVSPNVGRCEVNPAFPSTETSVAVMCVLVDVVVDAQGNPVPTTQIDPGWTYQGVQESPLLVVSQIDGKWVVDGDMTGRAS